MVESIASEWQSAFMQTVRRYDNAIALKDAAMDERLGDWTTELTAVVVATCNSVGWQASAIGHKLGMLPVSQFEYLGLDVMAFADGEKRWRYPVAVFELENRMDDDRIAYSLWKVMCVRADLRVVFCYRRSSDAGSALIRFLRDEVSCDGSCRLLQNWKERHLWSSEAVMTLRPFRMASSSGGNWIQIPERFG